jgi:hypothetical protein
MTRLMAQFAGIMTLILADANDVHTLTTVARVATAEVWVNDIHCERRGERKHVTHTQLL